MKVVHEFIEHPSYNRHIIQFLYQQKYTEQSQKYEDHYNFHVICYSWSCRNISSASCNTASEFDNFTWNTEKNLS